MAILTLDQVAIHYQTATRELDAISNVSFSVNEGEFLTIIGPSGCGKSTLLSAIAGLTAIDNGCISINNEGNTEGTAKTTVGYMLQQDCLFPWRTIKQNVYLGLEIKGMLTQENKDYADHLLQSYGLAEFKDSYPKELSGGMRQRVALIRTMAIKPSILLLDEALSALDYQTRLHVSEDLYHIIKSEGMTAILVTHDITEAISMSDRVVVLTKRPAMVKKIYTIDFKDGRGSPLICREKPEFGQYFNAIWRDIDAQL